MFAFTAGLVASVAWVALLVSGSGLGTLGGYRDSALRMVGFGSVLIAGWALIFVFALAFRRHWFRRYNLWLASAALVAAAIGALSFLSPSEGLLHWFSLDGDVSPGGQLGDMIVGSQDRTGWLRVVAALAVAGALFVLPAFRAVGDAILSLSNRRRRAMLAAPPLAPPFFEEPEDDSRTPPVAVLGVSGSPVRSGGEPSSWYTSSGSVGAGGSLGTRPTGGPDTPATGSSFSQTGEAFDFGSAPVRSSPVPSLANYIDGITGSESMEAGIKTALATPPAPESAPASNGLDPNDYDDPFKPLNLSKLPEPVFVLGAEPEAAAVAEREEAPEMPDVSPSESPDLEEIEDQLDESYDEAEVDPIDDDDFDAGLGEKTVVDSISAPEEIASQPVVVVDDSDSDGVVISNSGQDDFFMSQFDSAPAVVEAGEQPSFSGPDVKPSAEADDLVVNEWERDDILMSEFDISSGDGVTDTLLEYDDSDRGDFPLPDEESSDMPGNQDSSDTGDSLADLDSVAAVVDVSDQISFDDSIAQESSVSVNEPESVIMEDFDPDYLSDEDTPMSAPAGSQPNIPFKTNKYWGMNSGATLPVPTPGPVGLDSSPVRSTPVEVPVTSSWRKPSIRMFNTAPSNSITEEEQQATANAITKTLAEYGIEVGVKHIRPGPTVTMYGLTPGWVRRQRSVKQVDANGTPLKDERGRLVTKQVEEKDARKS